MGSTLVNIARENQEPPILSVVMEDGRAQMPEEAGNIFLMYYPIF